MLQALLMGVGLRQGLERSSFGAAGPRATGCHAEAGRQGRLQCSGAAAHGALLQLMQFKLGCCDGKGGGELLLVAAEGAGPRTSTAAWSAGPTQQAAMLGLGSTEGVGPGREVRIVVVRELDAPCSERRVTQTIIIISDREGSAC
jgi:hypothetical protein